MYREQWSSIRGNSALQDTLVTVLRYFWLSQLGGGGSAAGIEWVEARDAAERPPMHRAALTADLSSLKYQ